MKASELIKELQDAINKHGDLEVRYFIHDDHYNFCAGTVDETNFVTTSDNEKFIELSNL